MKYMLLMNYYVEGVPPIDEWAPEDVRRHIQFQQDLGAELVASGEFVDGQGLAWPDAAKLVRSDGVSAAGRHRRPVRGVEGVPGRVLDGRRRGRGARDRDRRQGVRRPRARRRPDPAGDAGPRRDGGTRSCRVTRPSRTCCASWRRRSSACSSAGPGTSRTREDALQDALLAATTQWPADGVPDNPRGWLVVVGQHKLVDRYRSEDARRRREELVGTMEAVEQADASQADDSLLLLFGCCHPALSPASAIALTLRSVGGLTTAEIARAFLVPEPTMAQRLSRARRTLRELDGPFRMPSRGRVRRAAPRRPARAVPDVQRGLRQHHGLDRRPRRPGGRGPAPDPDPAREPARRPRGHRSARPDPAHRRPPPRPHRPARRAGLAGRPGPRAVGPRDGRRGRRARRGRARARRGRGVPAAGRDRRGARRGAEHRRDRLAPAARALRRCSSG